MIFNKLLMFLLLCLVLSSGITQNISTNRNIVGMAHNMLFQAHKRFTVSQSGSEAFNLDVLFDGRFDVWYTREAVKTNDPIVILIEDLPANHTQIKAIVGWSTRGWPAKHFKVEGYNVYGKSEWRIITNYQDKVYDRYDFSVEVPSGAYTKLKFTFYSAIGEGGRMGLSELFYLHPEAVPPYYGLGHAWEQSGESVYRRSGNVGVGVKNPKMKLEVDGTVVAREIKVEAKTADFVFENNYQLRSLEEVETFIKDNKHLPEIAPAKEMQKNGVNQSEMNQKLLQKIEELTLYVIEQNKKTEALIEKNKLLEKEINLLKRNNHE